MHFLCDLPLFAEIVDIKYYFKQLNKNLNGVYEDHVEKVCLVTWDDLTYTKSAIVKMLSEENVIKEEVDPKMGLRVKLSECNGMKHHSYVYKNGKYKMTLTLNEGVHYRTMSEKEIYEMVELKCHPCSIQLLKHDYEFRGEIKIRFQNMEDLLRANKNIAGIAKNVGLTSFKETDKNEAKKKTDMKNGHQGIQTLCSNLTL